MQMKHWLKSIPLSIGLVTLVVSSVSGYAIQNLPFILESNDIIYENKTNNITASGNSRVLFKGYIIKSDTLNYNDKKQLIIHKGNVSVKQGGKILRANEFRYNFKTKKGELIALRTKVDTYFIKGESLTLLDRTSLIKNAEFTTCNLDKPHYKFTAKNMRLFPDQNNLVARKSTIKFYGTPVFYLPTYVYTPNSKKSFTKTVPEIGQNNLEGSYIKLYGAYFINPRSSGSLILGTSFKRGLVFGASHQLLLNKNNRLFLTGLILPNEGVEGGGIYEYDYHIKKQDTEKKGGLSQFFLALSKPDVPFTIFRVHVQKNYMENYQFVDYRPLVELDFTELNVPFGAKITGKLSGGRLKDSQALSNRYTLEPTISRVFPIATNTSFVTSYAYKDFIYDNQRWTRQLLTGQINYKTGNLFTSFSYTKALQTDGVSPFLVDFKDKINSDELSFKVNTSIWNTFLGIKANYKIKEEVFRDLMYSLGIKQHCWILSLNYNPIQESIFFDIKLPQL